MFFIDNLFQSTPKPAGGIRSRIPVTTSWPCLTKRYADYLVIISPQSNAYNFQALGDRRALVSTQMGEPQTPQMAKCSQITVPQLDHVHCLHLFDRESSLHFADQLSFWLGKENCTIPIRPLPAKAKLSHVCQRLKGKEPFYLLLDNTEEYLLQASLLLKTIPSRLRAGVKTILLLKQGEAPPGRRNPWSKPWAHVCTTSSVLWIPGCTCPRIPNSWKSAATPNTDGSPVKSPGLALASSFPRGRQRFCLHRGHPSPGRAWSGVRRHRWLQHRCRHRSTLGAGSRCYPTRGVRQEIQQMDAPPPAF